MAPDCTPWQWLRRELRVFITLALGVAAFMSLVLGKPFGNTLVYALCIGGIIQALVELGRYGLARRLRRRNPEHLGAQHNWPGWGVMGPWIIVSAIVGYYTGHALAELLTGKSGLPPQSPRTVFLILAVTFAVSIGCTYVFYARGRMAAMEARTQAAQRVAAEHQLKLMESQLEPHMLFNTLANLRVL
ncbi:MAG TPA: sensor histidine kinase, partial [Albitalea sp.]|nr:sensor histidine kinase [Albitalea sp.]